MKWIGLIAGLVCLCACSRNQTPENRVAASFHAEELPEDHKVDLSQRKIFPFSVVPGGTINQAEVKARAAVDPVVRQHYAGIQFDKLKPFRLTKPAQGYVSYRVGNRVFWTSNRLYLKAGEILLSDGTNLIRGRCGNRISLTAQMPILPPYSEPKQAVLDQPGHETAPHPALAAAATHPNIFSFDSNAPEPLMTMPTKVPESVFAVAPGVFGPGPIGGSFPGGLPPTGREGEIVLQSGYFWLFPYQPVINETLTFKLPPLTPVGLPSFVIPPTYTYGLQPIGGVLSVVFEIPFFPGSLLPPPPGITTTVPSLPPLTAVVSKEVVPPGTVVPPGNQNPPPPSPPEIETPPAFDPIPEPGTVWLVGLAALAWIGLKRRP